MNSREATNLSISMKNKRWSLNPNCCPRSLNLGARKTLTMPSRFAPELLVTWKVIVYGTC